MKMIRELIKLCFMATVAFWLLVATTFTFIVVDKIDQCEQALDYKQKCKLQAVPEELME